MHCALYNIRVGLFNLVRLLISPQKKKVHTPVSMHVKRLCTVTHSDETSLRATPLTRNSAQMLCDKYLLTALRRSHWFKNLPSHVKTQLTRKRNICSHMTKATAPNGHKPQSSPVQPGTAGELTESFEALTFSLRIVTTEPDQATVVTSQAQLVDITVSEVVYILSNSLKQAIPPPSPVAGQ